MTVAQDQEAHALVHCSVCFLTELAQPLTETLGPAVHRIQTGERVRSRRAIGVAKVTDFCQLVVVDHRKFQHHLFGVVTTLVEEVSFGAQTRRHRRDHLLPDGVERRIGHLRELLREVVEKKAGALRNRGNWGV